jgi:hypothetical protein
MIDSVNVSGSSGSLQVTFNSTLVPSLDQVNQVYVMFGADSSSETQQAFGQAASVNADGSIACVVGLSTTISPLHFTCYVTDYNNHTDASSDQQYPSNNGGTQDAAAALSNLTATGVVISWNSSDPGLGTVSYQRQGGDGTWLSASDDSGVSSTAHQVTLDDLIGSSTYNYTFSTNFDDPSLPDALSAQDSFNTAAEAGGGDKPGKVGVSVQPASIQVGQAATVTAQILKKDGTPQSGIPVAFSLGAGHAEGTLSSAGGVTDAKGCCAVSFNATGLPAGRKRARRFVVALAGDPSGKQKRRRALVIVMKA